MTTFRYRPYQRQDADAVKQLIGRSFAVDQLVATPHLLDSALEVVLRNRLLRSTYAQVAVQEGRIVGVLMGRAAGRRHLPGRLGHRLLAWRHRARLVASGIAEHKALVQLLQCGTIDAHLPDGAATAATDPVTLLAVDAPTQGHAIGRALYDAYLNHLRQHGRCDCSVDAGAGRADGFCANVGMPRTAAPV